MVNKKKKKSVKKTSKISKDKSSKKSIKNVSPKDFPTLKLKNEKDIAMDFAVKVYKKFDKSIKSVILFGSQMKGSTTAGSDIDLIILIDDVSINWDEELVAWYREELEKILKANPYSEGLHINTVKLSTWWEDLMRGDPLILNVLRYGESIIDFGGFFEPLKYLLIKGKIKSSPEAIYSALSRAPLHIRRSMDAELGAIEGLYWSMVDSAHAALIAAKVSPPSPEHIAISLKETFVDTKRLNMKYVVWYRDLHILHKKITHREISNLKGVEIDEWQDRAEKFLEIMAGLVKEIIS